MNRCARWNPTDYCTNGTVVWWRPDPMLAGVVLCPRHHIQAVGG